MRLDLPAFNFSILLKIRSKLRGSGGAICVKELTGSGWQPDFELSSFFVMIRNLLLEGSALLDMDRAQIDYTEEEAREAFIRTCQTHGWAYS